MNRTCPIAASKEAQAFGPLDAETSRFRTLVLWVVDLRILLCLRDQLHLFYEFDTLVAIREVLRLIRS